MTKSSPSLDSIQLLRAIAVWMVVFHHFAEIYIPPGDGSLFRAFFARYGAMGVDVFFVISGFVMHKSTNEKIVSSRVFIFNRLARIVPAYWFFTGLTALILLTFNKVIPLTEIEPIFLLRSLLFIPTQNPSGIGPYPLLTVGWTLSYEMAFYLIFGIALLFRSSFRLAVIAAGICLLQAAVPEWGAGFVFYAYKMGFEFLMGIAIGVIYCRNWLRIPFVISIILAMGSIGIISSSEGSHDYLKVGFPCAAIVAAALSQEGRFHLHGWLTKLGDWSYSTYLCHVIVLSVGYKATQMWDFNPWSVLPICCAMILLSSWISYTYIEQRATALIKRNFGSLLRSRANA